MTLHTLLQARDVPLDKILYASLGLIVAIVVGVVVVSQVRKRLSATDEPTDSGGFMLSDLRRLHKTGQMSDEEFERAKAGIIEAAKRASERDAAKAAGKPPGGTPRI